MNILGFFVFALYLAALLFAGGLWKASTEEQFKHDKEVFVTFLGTWGALWVGGILLGLGWPGFASLGLGLSLVFVAGWFLALLLQSGSVEGLFPSLVRWKAFLGLGATLLLLLLHAGSLFACMEKAWPGSFSREAWGLGWGGVFALEHLFRATDILDALEGFGIRLTGIKAISHPARLVLLGYHAVAGFFVGSLLFLLWRSLRPLGSKVAAQHPPLAFSTWGGGTLLCGVGLCFGLWLSLATSGLPSVLGFFFGQICIALFLWASLRSWGRSPLFQTWKGNLALGIAFLLLWFLWIGGAARWMAALGWPLFSSPPTSGLLLLLGLDNLLHTLDLIDLFKVYAWSLPTGLQKGVLSGAFAVFFRFLLVLSIIPFLQKLLYRAGSLQLKSPEELFGLILRGGEIASLGLQELLRRKESFADRSLQGLDGRGADFSEIGLTKADLSEAKLAGVAFRQARLCQARLWRTDLQGADLRGADLTGADLQESLLQKASLSNARLERADLRRASLQEADLQRADLTEAKLAGCTLQGADLRGARLVGVDLSGLTLTESHLEGMSYSETTLWPEGFPYRILGWGPGADLSTPPDAPPSSRTWIAKADKSNLDLRGIRLTGSAFGQGDFRGSDLQDADLRGASGSFLAKQAQIQRLDATGARFSSVEVESSDATGSRWCGLDLTSSSWKQTNLTRADLTGAILGEERYDALRQRHNPVTARIEQICFDHAVMTGLRAEYVLFGIVLALSNKPSSLKSALLSKARLSYANFEGVDLSGADLRGAQAKHTNFRKASLHGADLQGANLERANFNGADLKQADFRGATVSDGLFEDAELGGADFRGATATGELRGFNPHLILWDETTVFSFAFKSRWPKVFSL